MADVSLLTRIDIPLVVGCKFWCAREEDCRTIVQAISNICTSGNDPEAVKCMTICGRDGIGKSTLLTKLLSNEENDDFFVNDCRVRYILWIDGLTDSVAFSDILYYTLVENQIMPPPRCEPKCPCQVGRLVDEALEGRNLLLAIDNVKDVLQLHKNIEEFKSISLRVILLSSNFSSKSSPQSMPVSEMQTFTANQTLAIIADCITPSESRVDRVTAISGGLPVVVSPLLCAVTEDNVDSILDILEAVPDDLQEPKRVELVMYRLIYKQLEDFSKAIRNKYLAILLFDPNTLVELPDLSVLWRCEHENEAQSIAYRFCDTGFLQRFSKCGSNTEYYSMASLVFIAAVKCCNQMELASSLALLRKKIVDEAILTKAVELKRENLLRRIANNISPKELAALVSKQVYGKYAATFFQFLYKSKWTVRGGTGEKRNVPPQLLTKFLRRLHAAGIDTGEILAIPDRRGNCALLMIMKKGHDSPEHQHLQTTVEKQGCLREVALARAKKFWSEEGRNLAVNGPFLVAAILGDINALDDMLTDGVIFNVNTAKSKHGATATIAAAANGHDDIVRILLETKQANIEAADSFGSTALIEAAHYGHADIVRMLIDHGANVNTQNSSGVTALMAAANFGFFEVVSILCLHGANLDLKNEKGATALMGAAQNGRTIVVEYLLGKGADYKLRSASGDSAMTAAAEKGYADIVSMLLKRRGGNYPLEKNEAGFTALLLAAQNGHKSVVELLVKYHRLDVNVGNPIGATPLMLALQGEHFEVAKLLISNGAEVNAATTNGLTPIMLAALGGSSDVVQLLISYGAEIAVKDDRDVSALMLAAMRGHTEVVKLLIATGGDIHSRDKSGVNPLMAACLQGCYEMVEMLLKNGAHVDMKSNSGGTALMAACQGGHVGVARLLITEAHADINTADVNGNTAIMAAARNGHLDVVRYLSEKGAGISRRSSSGNNALMMAAMNGHAEVLGFLLKATAKVDSLNSKNSSGETALMMASRNGHINCVNLLVNNGADARPVNYHNFQAIDLAIRNGQREVVDVLKKSMELSYL